MTILISLDLIYEEKIKLYIFPVKLKKKFLRIFFIKVFSFMIFFFDQTIQLGFGCGVGGM